MAESTQKKLKEAGLSFGETGPSVLSLTVGSRP